MKSNHCHDRAAHSPLQPVERDPEFEFLSGQEASNLTVSMPLFSIYIISISSEFLLYMNGNFFISLSWKCVVRGAARETDPPAVH